MNIESPTFSDALYIFETPSGIARALKIKPQAVYQWGGRLPPLRVYELSAHIKHLIASDDSIDSDLMMRVKARVELTPSKCVA